MKPRKDMLSGIKGHINYLQEEGITHMAMPHRVQRASAAQDKSTAAPKKKTTTSRDTLIALKQTVDVCTKCSELVANRNTVVFGAGHARAELVFIGEAPGREEDKQGLPFVGRAGQLLTKMIESIGLTRKQVFIANVLKCRPPQNRNPLPDEIAHCEPYLLEQLKIIKPKLICTLGTISSRALLKTEVTISRLRGTFHDYHGIKLLPTFHPAYLLRNQSEKKNAWADMKMIKKELGV